MTFPNPTLAEQGDELRPAPAEPAAETTAEPAPDPVAAALERMGTELAQGNTRAAARERVIERLHEENQVLRAGERQSLLRPVVTDLYRLRDDLLKQAAGLPPDFGAERAAALLISYAQTVELALERTGVLAVRPTVGDPFDAGTHRASGVVPAAGPDADATVAEVLSDGYRDTVTERVLVPAAVRVARWSPAPDAA
jgi:molecular chaperone GrpE